MLKSDDITVIDNLGSDKSRFIVRRATGVLLVFLQKYLSDQNPIEEAFEKLELKYEASIRELSASPPRYPKS